MEIIHRVHACLYDVRPEQNIQVVPEVYVDDQRNMYIWLHRLSCEEGKQRMASAVE